MGLTLATMTDAVPLGRLCSEEDVANGALFLLPERAAFVNGQTLFVHAGPSALTRVLAARGTRVELVEGGLQPVGGHPDLLRERGHRAGLVQEPAALEVGLRERPRLGVADAVAAHRLLVSDDPAVGSVAVLVVAQHLHAVVVVGQRLVGEPDPLAVHGDQAGQAERAQVREPALLAAQTAEHRHRAPRGGLVRAVVDVPAQWLGQPQRIAVVADRGCGVVGAVRVVREVALAQLGVAGESARGDHHAEPGPHLAGVRAGDPRTRHRPRGVPNQLVRAGQGPHANPGLVGGDHPGHQRVAVGAQVGAFLGSLLEYYDFFIYGSAAALVFGTAFFPAGDPAVATVLSLATFGVAYLARPLGAVVFGHFGDRVGRRGVLLATLLLMGASSLAIGLLPTYESVGTLAPVLLVICRLVQGLSAGGEAAGASTLTLEYAPQGRRGLFTSFAMSGFAAGMVLATLAFLPVAALLRVVCCSLFAVFQTVFAVFALAFATSGEVQLDRSAMLWVSVVSNAVAIAAIPLWAALSDRIGRRPVGVFGALASAVTFRAYPWSIGTGSLGLVFDARVRYTGFAIGTQLGFLLAGFSPSIAAVVTGGQTTTWWPVAVFAVVCGVLSAVEGLTARETAHTPVLELGR